MKDSLKIIGGISFSYWIIITGVYIIPRLIQSQILYSLLTIFCSTFVCWLGLKNFLKGEKQNEK